MAASEASYVLRGILGTIPVLLDDQGRSFKWVPCQTNPLAWDEDMPVNIRRTSAQLCLTQCPALGPCGRLRDRLGNQARGVWAGKILTRTGEEIPLEPDTRPADKVPRRRRKVRSDVTQPLPDRVSVIRDEEP